MEDSSVEESVEDILDIDGEEVEEILVEELCELLAESEEVAILVVIKVNDLVVDELDETTLVAGHIVVVEYTV